MDSLPRIQNADEYLCSFNTTCLNILNPIAPMKAKWLRKKPEPWLYDSIRSLRQTCRRYEHKWLKDRLQVSYKLMRDSLSVFQKVVKSAKFKYLSEIINSNYELDNLTQWVTPCAKTFRFDSGLKFDKQINVVGNLCFFHLRHLAKVKLFLSLKSMEKVIHAFITSRFHYCNSLYYGSNRSSVERLQMVQNAAARLLTGTRNFQHITTILISLQWLPIKFRVELNI